MPDAFFASTKTRKRKRSTISTDGPTSSRKTARSSHGKQPRLKGKKASGSGPRAVRKPADEELSDKTDNEDEGDGVDDLDLRAPDVDPNAYESAEEDEDETPAQKRLRLAKLYLEGVKESIGLAEGEFDAAEIDRELISARLKQDVMEQSGKTHLYVADSYDLSNPPTLRTRGHKFSATAAVASHDGYWLYTSGKDGSIIKWDLQTGKKSHHFFKVRLPAKPDAKGKGKERAQSLEEIKGHTDQIWALALSPDGKFLASGGKDRRVGVWDVDKNEWVKGFTGHRDSVSALAFRKAQPTSTTPIQLYSGSFDRTLKIFDLSVMGYIETLFGHQAPVLDVDALMRETAVSVGGRDKSVRYWKVPEESQLVFRGGGRSGWEDVLEDADLEDNAEVNADGHAQDKARRKAGAKTEEKFVEGGLECVAMIDESTFLSGGDSGSICLWTTQKKKPVFTQALAHGMDESHVDTEDVDIVRKPRWVTALGSLRYSDFFASGSWDGEIRLWKLDSKLKSFSLIGSIPALGVVNTLQILQCPRTAVSQFAWATAQSKGHNAASTSSKTGPLSAILVAGVGQEMRFGRWVSKKGEGVLNGALVAVLHTRTSDETKL